MQNKILPFVYDQAVHVANEYFPPEYFPDSTKDQYQIFEAEIQKLKEQNEITETQFRIRREETTMICKSVTGVTDMIRTVMRHHDHYSNVLDAREKKFVEQEKIINEQKQKLDCVRKKLSGQIADLKQIIFLLAENRPDIQEMISNLY